MTRQILLLATSFLIINISHSQTIKSKATGLYNDGIVLKDKKKYSEAIDLFKNAIAEQPTYKEALFEAGWCCNELEKYDDALSFLQKAKLQWPNESKVYFEIGYAYQQLGKAEEAKTNYNECLSINKEYSLAYKALGNIFLSISTACADFNISFENAIVLLEFRLVKLKNLLNFRNMEMFIFVQIWMNILHFYTWLGLIY